MGWFMWVEVLTDFGTIISTTSKSSQYLQLGFSGEVLLQWHKLIHLILIQIVLAFYSFQFVLVHPHLYININIIIWQ